MLCNFEDILQADKPQILTLRNYKENADCGCDERLFASFPYIPHSEKSQLDIRLQCNLH